jgi:putative DNA primase/helicase
LEDAEQASLSYDIVIASPVISSGLSIEHRGAPHFTLVAFLGSGNAITPGDATQQIARVRYVDRCLIGVMRNNLPNNVLEEQLLAGRVDALALQNDQVIPGSYDRLVVGLKADEANGRADFAAGLFWLLEREGWLVCRGSVGLREEETQVALDEQRHLRAEKLMAASEVSVELTVERLRMLRELPAAERSEHQSQIEDLEIQLEAARIREALGVRQLLQEDIDLWDEGRIISKLEQFLDLCRLGPPPVSMTDGPFSLRSLRAARRQLYAELFEGYDVARPDWLTPDVAHELLDRIMRKPELFAVCGLVGAKYASGYIDKAGQIVPLKRPADPVREVTEILRRAGLAAVGKQVRVSQKGPDLVNTKGAICDKTRIRRYSTEGWPLMRDLARVHRETQRGRIVQTQDKPMSVRQLGRSLRAALPLLEEVLQGTAGDETRWSEPGD